MTNTPATPKGFGFGFEHLAASWFGMLKQAGDVADAALTKLNAGTYDGAAWSKSTSDLVGIGLTGYLDCVENFFGKVETSAESALLRVPADPIYERQVTIQSLVREDDPTAIVPPKLINVEPPKLSIGGTRFKILVSDSTYAGSNYTATVVLSKVGINPSNPPSQTIVLNVPL